MKMAAAQRRRPQHSTSPALLADRHRRPQRHHARRCPMWPRSADPNYGAIIVQGGVKQTVGGTSWASPTWAGFCALINQARAGAGQSSIGLPRAEHLSPAQQAELSRQLYCRLPRHHLRQQCHPRQRRRLLCDDRLRSLHGPGRAPHPVSRATPLRLDHTGRGAECRPRSRRWHPVRMRHSPSRDRRRRPLTSGSACRSAARHGPPFPMAALTAGRHRPP